MYVVLILLALVTQAVAIDDDFLISLQGRIYSKEKILSVHRWVTEYGNLICIYSRPETYVWGSDIEEQNMQHFVIYQRKEDNVSVVYKEDIYDIIIGIVQYNDGLLHVAVPGGSTNHTKTYSFDGKKVSMRFER